MGPGANVICPAATAAASETLAESEMSRCYFWTLAFTLHLWRECLTSWDEEANSR